MRMHRLSSFFQSLLRARAVLIGLGIIWCLLCLWFGRNVRPDFSVEQFFSSHSPLKQVFTDYQQDFPYEDNQVVVFWQEKNALDVHDYRDMAHMAQSLENSGLENVSWLGTAPRLAFLNLALMVIPQFSPLLPAELDNASLTAILETHHDDPLYVNQFWNADQTVFLLRGFVPKVLNQDQGRAKIEALLNQTLQDLGKPGRKLVLSGLPIIRASYLKYLNREQGVYLGGGILLACGMLFWFFRHGFQVFLSFTAIVPAYLTVLALLGLTGRPLTILTSTLPLILLLVGLSDTIHLLVHYRKRIHEEQHNHKAIVTTFAHFAAPCFYTSITTAIGFLSLTSTGIRIVVDFALFTALGIMLTYLFAMIFFPVFLSFYQRDQFNDAGLQAQWMEHFLNWTASLPARHSKAVLFSTLVVIVTALGLTSQLKVNSFLVDGVHPNHPLAQDLHWIDDQGFGLFQLSLYVEGSEDESLDSLKLLKWSEAYQKHFAQEDLVTASFSLSDYVKRVNMALQGSDKAAYVLPETQMELDFISEQIRRFLQPAVAYVWQAERQRGQIVLLVRDQGSLRMQVLINKLEAYLKVEPPPVKTFHLTGTVSMAQDSFSRTLQGFGSSLTWAIGLIFLCMLLLLRSLKYSLIALIPNLLPLLCLLASLQILGFSLEPTTVLVFSIAYGLAVDNTIHFLSHFQAYLQQGKTHHEALKETILHSGRAMLLTSLILGFGFVGLMLSSFKALFLFGLLIALSLIFALLGDLLVLPAALYFFSPKEKS